MLKDNSPPHLLPHPSSPQTTYCHVIWESQIHKYETKTVPRLVSDASSSFLRNKQTRQTDKVRSGVNAVSGFSTGWLHYWAENLLIVLIFPEAEVVLTWFQSFIILIIYMSVRNFVSHQQKISYFRFVHSFPQFKLGNVKTKNIFSSSRITLRLKRLRTNL